jgi:signal transduction histidine kinase
MGPRSWFGNRNLQFARSGKFTAYAVIGLALGLCLATAALVWLGYVATREWRHGTEVLMERRQIEAAALVGAALDRDMKGASTFALIPMNRAMLEEEPPYDLLQLTARTFARFPYPESLVVWKSTPDGTGVTYVFNRAERHPTWDTAPEAEEPFPVIIKKNPPALANLVALIARLHEPTRSFGAVDTALAGIPYQVIVHYLSEPGPPYRLSAFAAFTVNLSWVRAEYFLPVLRQVATIGENTDVLSFSVTDDRSSPVAATGRAQPGASDSRRTFPLLFIDRVLVLPLPSSAQAEWAVHVGSSGDSTLMAARDASGRTFALIALSALVTIGALLVTVRAVEARAALTTMKSDFVSAVTHELKTPVALIRLVGDTLASGRYASPSKVEDYARLLSQEANRLSLSIDQLLTYARYSDAQRRDGLEFSTHDVGALIEQGIETMRSALAAADFHLEIDLPRDLPPIKADANALTQVIENLIDNSIKYVGPMASLRITARANGKYVKVIFADHGIGIPRDDVDHVLDQFYRGRNASAKGSGLGLAIAKRVVESHGGRIHVRSTVDVGTEVELQLPIGTAS